MSGTSNTFGNLFDTGASNQNGPTWTTSGTFSFADSKPATPDGRTSLFGQSTQSMLFGTNSAARSNVKPLPAKAGTSTPPFSFFGKVDPTTGANTSLPSGPSSEGLSVGDNVAPPQTISVFGVPLTTQRPTTSPLFGSGTSDASGATTNQPQMGLGAGTEKQQSVTGTGSAAGISPGEFTFGKPEQQPVAAGASTSVFGNASASGEANPVTEVKSFGQPADVMLEPSKVERIEELLRRSLLGEEIVNTQFHLYSTRSSASGLVMKPRVLCVNNALLANSSKFILDLLSEDTSSSDPSLVDLVDEDDVPHSARITDYGYESDSDLEDCDDHIPVTNSETPKDQPTAVNAETESKVGEGLSLDGSEPAPSAATSAETVVQETVIGKRLGGRTATRSRSSGSRHVLVNDTAFQTWYTLLNYLYTSKLSFLPLSSTMPGKRCNPSTNSLDKPRCSAKSMYRLASKVGLDHVRDKAMTYIRNNLTEHNILEEISCSVVSKHPKLLELELDLLYSHITSPPVVANFATLAQRIARKELPHGADIIIGIHARILKEHRSFALKPGVPTSFPSFSGLSVPSKSDPSTSDTPDAESRDKTESSLVGTPQSGFTPLGGNRSTRGGAVTKEPDEGRKRRATEKRKSFQE